MRIMITVVDVLYFNSDISLEEHNNRTFKVVQTKVIVISIL